MNTVLQEPKSTKYSPLYMNKRNRKVCELTSVAPLPDDLNGTLYRNGPGIFKRGNFQKENLLDGDGIVQRLQFEGGRAFYSRRFVDTPKYLKEQAQDQFLYPTWTTNAQNPLANLGDSILSQAGVTVYDVHGKIFALDEVSPGFELDRESLLTKGPVSLGLPENDSSPKAHARHLAQTDEWIFASTRISARGMHVDFTRHQKSGKILTTPTVKLPRTTYLHDFGATANYAVLILHSVEFQPFSYLSGLKSFTDSLSWKSSIGNQIVVVDLSTGDSKVFEAEAAWSWHVANVYQDGPKLVVDFIGYSDAEHFLGTEPQLKAVMAGRTGKTGSPGTLRRYELNMHNGELSERCLLEQNLEFPSVRSYESGMKHSSIYMTIGSDPGVLHTGIASFDTQTGLFDTYDFGSDAQVGEPVFAQNLNKQGHGWLIAQVLDTARETTEFHIFDALHVSNGPISSVSLEEPMSISFHGHWSPSV